MHSADVSDVETNDSSKEIGFQLQQNDYHFNAEGIQKESISLKGIFDTEVHAYVMGLGDSRAEKQFHVVKQHGGISVSRSKITECTCRDAVGAIGVLIKSFRKPCKL